MRRTLKIYKTEMLQSHFLYEDKNKQTSVTDGNMDDIKLQPAYLLLVLLLQFLLPRQRSLASIARNLFTQIRKIILTIILIILGKPLKIPYLLHH